VGIKLRNKVGEQIRSLNVRKRRGERAPHKPLLVLLALWPLAEDPESTGGSDGCVAVFAVDRRVKIGPTKGAESQ